MASASAAPTAAAPASAPAGHLTMSVPAHGALPEDLFADLTGLDLNKPHEPMGVKSPSATSPAAADAAAPGADPFGFADFSSAPGSARGCPRDRCSCRKGPFQ